MEVMQDGMRFNRMIVASIIAHCLLLVLVSLLWSGSEVPPVKVVQLVIESRPVAKEVIAEVRRESAPSKAKQDSQELGAKDNSLESLLERSTYPHKAAPARELPNRRREDEVDYGSLRRDQESPYGRLERNPDDKDMQSYRPSVTDRDTKDREGDRDTIGRDDVTRQTGKTGSPGVTGADLARQGDRGAGVTGQVNLRGRNLVYRPVISLPERYSRQGLSYTVQIEIMVTEEGIVSRAAISAPSGNPELDILLEQRARMFRFEAAAMGTGNQSGTIAFSIQPR
jgi:TonB family protein